MGVVDVILTALISECFPRPGTACALEHIIRAMDNPPSFESIAFANERVDDIDFDGGIVLDVLNRLW